MWSQISVRDVDKVLFKWRVAVSLLGFGGGDGDGGSDPNPMREQGS